MKPLLIYCYDAWCGWCYGFSKVITQIEEEYRNQFDFEVLSGGMILPETPQPFSSMATFIQGAYKRVEELTGIKFGEDFLWHVFNPDKTDWYPSSEMSAIALCIMKEYHPHKAVQMAVDLEYALNDEGRDLTDGEAYRHLLPKYKIPEDEFYAKLKSEEYKEKAYYEFALVKQLQVTGYPTVLLQLSETKFYLLAQGYTDYQTLKERLEAVKIEIG